MLRLNSIESTVFDAVDMSADKDIKIKLNGTTELSRKSIIATGRMVACEFFGDMINKNPNCTEKYNSRLADKSVDYATLSKAHREKKLLFCAAQADKMSGREAPKTFEEFKKNSASYGSDAIFLRAMAAIDRDILDPLFFNIMDSVGMGLMQWEPVELGQTKEITIRSNDVFRFEDGSWGSGRSTSKNYLYAKTVTLTPKMYTCNATIKWYQDIVNGDAGRYYAAIMLGMYNKIYAINMSLIKSAVANTKYVPSGLVYNTYTTSNWIAMGDKVAAINGVSVSDLMAIGTRSSLSNVLPVDGTGGAITGLQYGLGERWFENGFLPKAGGIDLFPVSPVVVPGTQNSTIDTIDTGTSIYLLAKAGNGYKPMYGAYADGSPITLTATPGGNGTTSYGTADFTIDINVGAMFDIKPVFATKIGVMTAVYPNA